ALRRSHPSLRLPRYADGNHELISGVPRIAWYDLDGEAMSESAWEFAEGKVLGLRRAFLQEDGQVDLSLLIVNGGPDDVNLRLPPDGGAWTLKLDTVDPGATVTALSTDSVMVAAHGCVVLTRGLTTKQAHGGT